MNSKQKLEEELYNINDYTDEELYEILDLLNPSDRELEAKILFFIQKYENMGTEAGIKISKFFEDVYNHFFDTDEDGYEEQYIYQDTTKEGYENAKTSYSDEANKNYVSNDYKTSNGNAVTSGNTIPSANTVANEKRNENVVFTTNLEYTKDPLNPLLKQTTTRIISIDSQYRDDKTSLTTDFSCELSEPLRDVVSMKLYSFQIPYTWYTISKSYGCNFFYLKGNTDGINTGRHDISFSINPGNYTPSELATTVQSSITNARNIYTDVSFGNTNINYNSNTSLSTLTIDIKNIFNENGYYMNFPYFTSPYRNDLSRNDSIPGFLGFETRNYNTNSIKSKYSLPLVDSSINIINDNSNIFYIDNTNNYFRVIKYIGIDEYNSNSNIDTSFNIYFNLPVPGFYSRNTLVNDISNAIYNSQFLDNTYQVGSSIKRINIDPSNNMNPPDINIPPDVSSSNYVNAPNNSYFELKIKPSRFTTKNINNSKMVVEFPNEVLERAPYFIWRGNTSCFRFENEINELNTIYAEYPVVKEPQIFIIDNSVKILLKCVENGFDISSNDIIVNIPPNISTIDNYSFVPYESELSYIDSINNAIKAADVIYNGSLNSSAANGTKAYIDDDGYFNLYLDIEKSFNESTYNMDLTNSIFNSVNIQLNDNGNTILTDLTRTYSSFINFGGIVVTGDTILAEIYPNPNTAIGNKGDVRYILKFPETKLYTDYVFFENDVNSIFSSYIDPKSGRTIFAGTNLSHVVTDIGYQITFTIKITKKLVSKNYSINFVDTNTTNESWRNYLFIDTKLYNKFYNFTIAFSNPNVTIIKNESGTEILYIDNMNAIRIKGITPLIYRYLNIQKDVNDKINFIAYEDGLVNSTGTNNLIIDIFKDKTNSTLAITVKELIHIINTQFDNSDYFKGSKISTYYIGNYQYLKIRMNTNRIYTIKDYNLVFYDEYSFVKCNLGSSSVQNTTWDSTLGWILGFRNYTIYIMTDFEIINDTVTIIGDTGVCTNLYNYFLLCLDDYNQNHLNDGLVTIANKETSIRLPSYANPSNRTCDPVTGQLTYNTSVSTDNKKLTANQIYALTEISNSQYSTETTGSTISSKSYGNSPSAKDVIAILPMKVAGLQNGASYMEYGGTLQNQGRSYFGPVNIRKLAVSLLSDRGNKVDLNNANWSFSLIVETLNKLKPTN
jgi:hypothetical protein